MLQKIIKSYDVEINSLNEFFQLIKPIVDDVHTSALTSNAHSLGPIILAMDIQESQEEQSKLLSSKESAESEEMLLKIDADIGKIQQRIDASYKKIKEIDSSIKVEVEDYENVNGETSAKLKIIGDSRILDKSFTEINEGRRKKRILYRSTFTSLISISEYYFSQLMHFIYDKYPQKANIGSKPLNLNQLKSFGNVQDAVDFLVADKVENIVRQDVESWFEILKSELKLSMGYYEVVKSSLVEIYLRRNIIIHNGGVVNSIYLSKVDSKLEIPYKKGEEVNISFKYLAKSISMLHRIFLLAGFELWKKLEPESNERGELLSDLSYENMLRTNWEVARGLGLFLKGDKQQTDLLRTIGELNYWHCSMRANIEVDKIKKEMHSADYSSKSAIFRCALASLHDDFESFTHLAKIAIESKDLSLKHLYEFPILEAMRDNDNFEIWTNQNGYANPIEEIEITENIEEPPNSV